LPPSFLSSSPAKSRASEDSALRALTAKHRGLRSREKAMNLGKDEQRPMGQGMRRAQARSEETAGGIRDQSRMAATRYEARGNAREPDGGTPGCNASRDKK
jgi:hypothetical protein